MNKLTQPRQLRVASETFPNGPTWSVFRPASSSRFARGHVAEHRQRRWVTVAYAGLSLPRILTEDLAFCGVRRRPDSVHKRTGV